jgi:Arc/MetJ-type ribon-helix-helix transcriptional regulator
MKLSVSLPEDDVAFIDDYAARSGEATRSSVIHQGIALLRMASLENAYAEAWQEWEADADSGLWESTSADGIIDAQG